MSINIKAFDKDENRACVKDSEFLGQIDTLKDGEPNEYWTVDGSEEHYTTQPVPTHVDAVEAQEAVEAADEYWTVDGVQDPYQDEPTITEVEGHWVINGSETQYESQDAAQNAITHHPAVEAQEAIEAVAEHWTITGEDSYGTEELALEAIHQVKETSGAEPTEEQLEDVRKTLFGTNKAWVPRHLLHDLVDVHE